MHPVKERDEAEISSVSMLACKKQERKKCGCFIMTGKRLRRANGEPVN